MFEVKLREIFLIFKFEVFRNYSFVSNCVCVGGGGGVKLQILRKNLQVHLIIIRE